MHYRNVTTQVFDRVLQAYCVSDEHDYLESRFLDKNDRVIAKVLRHLDEDEELLPEADLLVAEYLISSDVGSRAEAIKNT